MALNDLADRAEEIGRRRRDRVIAVYIAVLAVLLAICGLGSGNAEKEATARNIEAANTWAFFQAKNIRRHQVRIEIASLELRLATEPELLIPARRAIEARIAKYRADEARLSSEPATGEGLKELYAKGKALEIARDRAMQRDPYFDYGQVLLQIAIVLASVAIIAGGMGPLVLSGILALGGTLAMLNGYTLAVSVPFIS
jgi:hypothetical protein